MKKIINGLYGKFATYTPVAAFATAYARDNIIRTASKCYGRFQYADTDSIHKIRHNNNKKIKERSIKNERKHYY